MPWFPDLDASPHLDEFGFRHLGIVRAIAPYRFDRPKAAAPVFLACVSGTGRVRTGGRWIDLPEGNATMLTAGKSWAYHAVEESPWKMVWVCFGLGARVPEASLPGRRPFEVEPLYHAMECLLAECRGGKDPFLVRQMLGMIERMLGRFISPVPELRRFYGAWERIEASLGAGWTLESLSQEAACSVEQFRRLCQREFGTSPRRHLTDLRLVRARRRLAGSDDTIEQLAREAGYADPCAFADAFRRRAGLTPSEFRRRNRVSANPSAESPGR